MPETGSGKLFVDPGVSMLLKLWYRVTDNSVPWQVFSFRWHNYEPEVTKVWSAAECLLPMTEEGCGFPWRSGELTENKEGSVLSSVFVQWQTEPVVRLTVPAHRHGSNSLREGRERWRKKDIKRKMSLFPNAILFDSYSLCCNSCLTWQTMALMKTHTRRCRARKWIMELSLLTCWGEYSLSNE